MLERAVRVDPRRIIMGCAKIRLVVVPTVVPTAPLLDVASSRLAGSERPRDVGPTICHPVATVPSLWPSSPRWS